jgi:hypothetical protein
MNEENNMPVADNTASANPTYVPVEKLDFAQLLSDAWQLGQTKFWNLLGIYLVMTVIMVVAMVIAGVGAAILGSVIYMAHLPALLVLFIGLAILGLIVLLMWVSAWGVIASLRYLDHAGNPTIAELLADAKPKAWDLVPTMIITALAVIGGFFFFIIPGIIMGISLSFVFNVMVFENKTMWAALTRSRDLVRGRWWNLFVIFVAFFIFSMILIAATGASYSPIVILLSPFAYILSYVMYKKLVSLPAAAKPVARSDWYYKAAAAFGLLIIAAGLLGATAAAGRNWNEFKNGFNDGFREGRQNQRQKYYDDMPETMLNEEYGDEMKGVPLDLTPAQLEMLQ